MSDHLDQYVRTELYKQFKDSVAVVLDRKEADGILVEPGGNQSIPRPASASVPPPGSRAEDLMILLLDRSGKVILWSDDFGVRDAISSNADSHAMAKRIIHKLKRAMERSRFHDPICGFSNVYPNHSSQISFTAMRLPPKRSEIWKN